MKKKFQGLAALGLAIILSCAPAAAASPTLQYHGGDGNTRLTLEQLGDRPVYSVQLELTVEGNHPQVSFAPGGSGTGIYGHCDAEVSGNRTAVTIYLDSPLDLNQGGSLDLGALSVGDFVPAGSAGLTLLNRGMEPSEIESIPVRSGGSSGGAGQPGDGGSSGDSGGYMVQVFSGGHGTVKATPQEAGRGDTVTVAVEADRGWRLSQLTAVSNGRKLTLTPKKDGTYTFSMPGTDVEVRGTFVRDTALPFADVKEGSWYYEAAGYAYDRGLMSGTAGDTFSPDMTTSRGMIVTILYSLAGSPAGGTARFDDVADGQYYARAVAWAAGSGVVSGYGDGRFGPNDPITREQLALILRSFARFSGRDVSARTSLAGYTDAGEVHAYAVEAVEWAIAQGLISGMGNRTLAPQGSATRAQAAVVLKGFCQRVMEEP